MHAARFEAFAEVRTSYPEVWHPQFQSSSAHRYRAVRDEVDAADPSDVPTGVAVFPTDPAIRRVLERRHRIVHWTEFDRGGHFAAMEAPDLLVQDLREFFRGLR